MSYEFYTDPRAMIKIRRPDGGQIPEQLSGFYTSIREAKIAVDKYQEVLDNRPIKAKKAD